ncbi:MAG: alpha/beta hydrolase domain-containing protein [bacterium]
MDQTEIRQYIAATLVDIMFAPRNSDGLVEARANFVVLQPSDPNKGRGVALVEVSNRGGKFSPSYFNRAATSSLDPDDPDAWGDQLLMRQGLTVIWVGWQYDVPQREGALRLEVPRATNLDGSPIYGLVRSDWTLDRPARSLQISHRNHKPYPVADPKHRDNVLTVRNGRESERRIIPREQWRFAREDSGTVTEDLTHIYLQGGFKAGKIYELVYRAKDPAVVGLGLAVIRDVISYAKYAKQSAFPAQFGIAAGVSQTGRFLRHFLYQGFNTDEESRQAYDGLMIMTAGAGRGSFNHRFAQPSRDAHRYSAFFYPTDIFPFTSRTQTDKATGGSDGLLAHQHLPGHLPKTFYINTGYEYWGRAAALIHTSVDGKKDIEPFENERIYQLSSGQHFVSRRFPPQQQIADRVFRGNPLEFKVNYRALLVQLVQWVADETLPPASAYPRIDANSLVTIDKVAFPKIPGTVFPSVIHVGYRADYGPRWSEGIIDYQPPKLGTPFQSMVSQVDQFGNEIGGVRNVELRVPLVTYTPWSLRSEFAGGKNELVDFRGTFIPFPRTEKEKQQTGDPRPSILSLYKSRKYYLTKVEEAAKELVQDGFLLDDDIGYVRKRAERYWNWILEKMQPKLTD